MLPYSSYLRVYEPGRVAEPVGPHNQERLRGAGAEEALATEQRQSLSRAVRSPALAFDDGETLSYQIERDGLDYTCPVDMPLRSWLSLASLVDSIGDANLNVLLPSGSIAMADEAFLRWRRDNPRAVPHIRQSTWGVPRTWFVLVAPDERESYSYDGVRSIRYRAQIVHARARLSLAHEVLDRLFDESDVVDEVDDLDQWLASFDESSWLELDYAGVAQLLGAALESDYSARDIQLTLRAVRKGDFSRAGAAYRSFEERWRAVNAFERAN